MENLRVCAIQKRRCLIPSNVTPTMQNGAACAAFLLYKITSYTLLTFSSSGCDDSRETDNRLEAGAREAAVVGYTERTFNSTHPSSIQQHILLNIRENVTPCRTRRHFLHAPSICAVQGHVALSLAQTLYNLKISAKPLRRASSCIHDYFERRHVVLFAPSENSHVHQSNTNNTMQDDKSGQQL